MSYPGMQHISAKREASTIWKKMEYIARRAERLNKSSVKEMKKLQLRLDHCRHFLNPCHDFGPKPSNS